jgi:hypothetical protein
MASTTMFLFKQNTPYYSTVFSNRNFYELHNECLQSVVLGTDWGPENNESDIVLSVNLAVQCNVMKQRGKFLVGRHVLISSLPSLISLFSLTIYLISA